MRPRCRTAIGMRLCSLLGAVEKTEVGNQEQEIAATVLALRALNAFQQVTHFFLFGLQVSA